MSADREDAIQQKDKESEQSEDIGDMHTIISKYESHSLIDQADTRLVVHPGFPNDSSYSHDFQYAEEADRISPGTEHERINVVDAEDVVVDCAQEADNLYKSHVNDKIATELNVHDLSQHNYFYDVNRNTNSRLLNEGEEKRQKEYPKLSWHPHVYGKPPKKPTPHTIEYILGLSNAGHDNRETVKDEPKRLSVSKLMNVKRNFEIKKPTANQERSIQVQTDFPDPKHNINIRKNKLQEQLLQRSARTAVAACNNNSHFRVKYEDQPLNLSIPKAKDCPRWSPEMEEEMKDSSKMKRKKSTEDVLSPLGGEGSLTSEEGEETSGRRKKARTTFTGRQIFELEKLFEVKKYLSSGDRADMAKLLNVTETQACIIGKETKKCLFVGVKNKYCFHCHVYEKEKKTPPTHTCFKNFEGPSGGMEATILVEGFKNSEQMHGVQYLFFIGDGDSSVYAQLRDKVSYGQNIKKIECKNHVMKNYTGALYKVKIWFQNRRTKWKKKDNVSNAEVAEVKQQNKTVLEEKKTEESAKEDALALDMTKKSCNKILSEKLRGVKQVIAQSGVPKPRKAEKGFVLESICDVNDVESRISITKITNKLPEGAGVVEVRLRSLSPQAPSEGEPAANEQQDL